MPITKDNAHQYLPLVQALAEGKTVQVRVSPGSSTFIDMHPSGLTFQERPEDYRIKPEPRRFTVMVPKPNHPNSRLRPRVKKPDITYDPHFWEAVEVAEVMDE